MKTFSTKFDDIYQRVLEYWPDEVVTTDRVVTMSEDGFTARFPRLSEAEDNAETALLNNSDEWAHLLNWTLYIVLHDVAQRQDAVYPRLVNKEYVRWLFAKTLRSDTYKAIVGEYQEHNSGDFRGTTSGDTAT